MLRDEQTHVMPETPEDVAVIARLMGYADLRRVRRRATARR